MAAARPLPEASSWTIGVEPGGIVSSANANLQLSTTEGVSFHNTATFPVNIIFTNMFSEIKDLLPGATSGAQGGSAPLNVTVNYIITNANTSQQTGGPYSIQFGIGALPITISGNNSSPDPVAIPHGGQIAFSSDSTYPILWTFVSNGQPANVWSPQPTQISPGQNTPQTALAGANGQAVQYTIPLKSETRGGGTVTVGS